MGLRMFSESPNMCLPTVLCQEKDYIGRFQIGELSQLIYIFQRALI